MAVTVSVPMAVLLTLGSLHGCTRGAAMIDVNENSAGHPVTLDAGDGLRIRLAENVTTGYRWELDSGCGSLLHLEGDEAAPASTNALGAGGMRTWTFSSTASAEGQCELRFEYARPWEKNATGRLLRFPIVIQRGS